jgi:hypothetical protein
MDDTVRKAQLDDAERRHLEKIVKQLRERAEETVEYWVHSKLNLAEEDADAPDTLSAEERELRGRVKEAIEREQAGERSWAKARDLYVKGVGYTLVNRLAALRCMEVRGFLDRSPTRFRDDGVTPAADRLITDYFLPREAGIWTAFLVACQERSEEIEILFDLSDPYSLLYGDLTDWEGEPKELAWSDDLQASLVDLLQDLGGLLDEVEDAVWRADDVLGWVYEYYNMSDLGDVREKARGPGLDAEDVPVANQFYTPHWVVRMLTDNSLGKLFLEHEGTLQETIQRQDDRFTPEERKTRDASAAASIEELCTYLVATEEEGEATDFEHPSEIRVFDPACGSGHFLLYAFDVLERIWWAMEPEIPRSEIPRKILQHNLYGVDLDLRACQLAAFNLYLKGRSRAEYHGSSSFSMPNVGIVCADVHGLDTQLATEVFDAVAGGDTSVRSMLSEVCGEFVETPGLGSLFNPTAQIEEQFVEHGAGLDSKHGSDLEALFRDFRESVEQRLNGDGFAASDLRSLARLLTVLTQDYDVTLMNPPYGARERMPEEVRTYVKDQYDYTPEFYINFFEVGERLSKEGGRIGMLVPHSFMFRKSFQEFREDFVGDRGAFDFLAEFGYDILDNAMVGTVGTAVRVADDSQEDGVFIRLHDAAKEDKENEFLKSLADEGKETEKIQRKFFVANDLFASVPGTPIAYSIPKKVLELHSTNRKIDPGRADISGEGVAECVKGLDSGKNARFIRNFWEVVEVEEFVPHTKGGSEAWIHPKMRYNINWMGEGVEIERLDSSRPQNMRFMNRKGLTWTYVKRTGRRFGYIPKRGTFDSTGPMLFPNQEGSEWSFLAVLNSDLYHSLFLSLTLERHWQVSDVGRIPWPKSIQENDAIGNLARRQFEIILNGRIHDPTSPYYMGPELLPESHGDSWFYSDHSLTDDIPDSCTIEFSTGSFNTPLRKLALVAERKKYERNRNLERLAKKIDESVFAALSIEQDTRKAIRREIFLRTSEEPEDREVPDPEEVELTEAAFESHVKHLLLYLSFEIVEEDGDGIVLLRAESDEEEADLLTKMTAKFEDIWGEYAEDRLQEVDEVLGNREPTDEPYPNLRHWLENDLFAFHCDEFENTPILWELTTERLGDEDNEDAGFACLIDYHQLGPDLFDRLSARYLETRKAALRERQQSARRTAEGSEGTQAREARQEEKRCENALRQIDELETRISKLTQTHPRDWASEVQEDARDLQPKVRRFRERLEERLETLDALHEEAPSSWFKDHFSDKFMESVNGNREEWIDALEDLEAACEQFARPADQPVEAHLYDLLPYFDDLTGSTHYSSNGIFFLNYYFSKGKDLAAKIDQGNKDRVTRREQLVAALARETDDDIELGKEINEACQAMKKHMDSDWKPRALEEVRTPGYRPVKKHGVAINITPLAEKKLVPELVDKKVL